MALAGWDSGKKIKITIDPAAVSADLTDFPVLVHLSASSGKTGFDASAVFAELGANSKRIAFEIGDTGNQCYAEIEFWDDANSKAVLHVKVPSILAVSGATLYLYYDNTQADNTTYIGDTGDTAAQNVWDSNFVAVYHMAQDPSGAAPQILDSTSNANHGTSYGSMTSADLVDGLVCKAIAFDGVDDQIQLPSNFGLSAVGATLETLFLTDQLDVHQTLVSSYDSTIDVYKGYFLRVRDTNVLDTSWSYNWTNNARIDRGNSLLSAATYYYAATSIENRVGVVYLNGVDDGYNYRDDLSTDDINSVNNCCIGIEPNGGYEFKGIIEEVRISNISRSDAWIAATNLSLRDQFVTLSFASTILKSLLKQPYYLRPGDVYTRSIISQLYEPCQFARAISEQQYWACQFARQLITQLYGLQLQAMLRQPYGCSPVVTALLRQWYSSTSDRRRAIDQQYGCAMMIRRAIAQPYDYPEPLRQLLWQRYHVSGGQVMAIALQAYHISEYALARKILAQQYGLMPEGGTADFIQETVTIDGRDVGAKHISIEGGTDQYCLSCEVHLVSESDYMLVTVMDEIVITIDRDYRFFVESVERSRTHGSAEFVVRGLSMSALLDEPYAEPVTEDLSGMASVIVDDLAGDITTDYLAVDWYIPADTLLPGDSTPMQVIRSIASAAGAVVQTEPDGTLVVVPRYPVSVPVWEYATPDHVWSDMLDFFSVGETFDHRPGYNRYLVSDQAEAADTLRLEDETISTTEHIIRAYQTPWKDDFDLRHTGGDWVGLEPLGIEERAIDDEVVEFVAGEGRTRYPIYGITGQEWLRQPLGTVTSSEDGTLRSAVEGESLLRISYVTRCRRYRMTDQVAEPVQVVAEGVDDE